MTNIKSATKRVKTDAIKKARIREKILKKKNLLLNNETKIMLKKI